MIKKRIIPCLDVKDGRLTKGIKFQNNADIGDPVLIAEKYAAEGADEIIFFDITASAEGRSTFLDVAQKIAQLIHIPLAIGGGVSSLHDIEAALAAGAKKVVVNSAAVLQPELITEAAKKFGSEKLCIAIDVAKTVQSTAIPTAYEIFIQGGRKATGKDALAWAKECQDRGASELCVNSIDADGTREGYDIPLTALISQELHIPVIASGGAGSLEDIYAVLTQTKADAALVASIVHYGDVTIPQIKKYLEECDRSRK